MPCTSVFKQTISHRMCRASRSNANPNEFIIALHPRLIQLYRDRRWCRSERVDVISETPSSTRRRSLLTQCRELLDKDVDFVDATRSFLLIKSCYGDDVRSSCFIFRRTRACVRVCMRAHVL